MYNIYIYYICIFYNNVWHCIAYYKIIYYICNLYTCMYTHYIATATTLLSSTQWRGNSQPVGDIIAKQKLWRTCGRLNKKNMLKPAAITNHSSRSSGFLVSWFLFPYLPWLDHQDTQTWLIQGHTHWAETRPQSPAISNLHLCLFIFWPHQHPCHSGVKSCGTSAQRRQRSPPRRLYRFLLTSIDISLTLGALLSWTPCHRPRHLGDASSFSGCSIKESQRKSKMPGSA